LRLILLEMLTLFSLLIKKISHNSNKKLSYSRGTVRRAVSVETARNVAQMLQATDLQGHSSSLEMEQIDRPYMTARY